MNDEIPEYRSYYLLSPALHEKAKELGLLQPHIQVIISKPIPTDGHK